MAALIEQILSMQASMETSLQVGILIATIDVAVMWSVISAIKTISESDVAWDSMSESLIEEWRAIKKRAQTGESSAAGKCVCDFCSRPGHSVDTCWIKPASPHNRLKALRKGGKGPSDKSDSDDELYPKPRSNNS